MKKLINMVVSLLILCGFAIPALSSTDVENIKIQQYYDKYRAELDHMPQWAMDNIITSYAKGQAYDMGLSLAVIDFLESRGGLYMVNNRNSNGSMDCGRYGSNTRTYHYYKGMNDNKVNMVHSCSELIKDEDLAIAHAIKTLSIGKKIGDSKSGVYKWRHKMNYYNTGRKELAGEYYLKAAAVAILLREVLDLKNIKLALHQGIYVGVLDVQP